MKIDSSMRITAVRVVACSALSAVLLLAAPRSLQAQQDGKPASAVETQSEVASAAATCDPAQLGSPFIPVDSWIYPAVLRLYSLGFIDNVYLGMRPWTRASVSHMLEVAGARIQDADGGAAADAAEDIFEALSRELRQDVEGPCGPHKGSSRVESVYSEARGITGTPLRDSYHLGSTIINDYGRPYANGFNNFSGASGYASSGRFQLYLRGEFHGAPSAAGYSSALATELLTNDAIQNYFTPSCWLNGTGCTLQPLSIQTILPAGPVSSVTNLRMMEAYVSFQYLNHVISFGKQDEWQGPGQGGAMSYSNNAENIYALHINRIEPLNVPLLSRLTGPFRYEFLVGPLRGHTYPFDPWVHVEKVSLRPTKNLEFGFERTVIWGGKDHEPVTIKTFLRSFFSVTAPDVPIKNSPQDPGARFGAFDFSYRLPFVRNWLTIYSDSEVHDDVSPADNPRHASWRPGIYLSRVPGIPKLDFRAEGVSTDPPTSRSTGGFYMYFEAIQRQGYTNQGQLFGDWIGREDKGGQAWLTYHLSGNEMLQVSMRNQKAEANFIPGGTTLNDLSFRAVKRLGKEYELDGNFTLEHWKAPIYLPGEQTVTTTMIQLKWLPQRKVSF